MKCDFGGSTEEEEVSEHLMRIMARFYILSQSTHLMICTSKSTVRDISSVHTSLEPIAVNTFRNLNDSVLEATSIAIPSHVSRRLHSQHCRRLINLRQPHPRRTTQPTSYSS